MKKLHLLAIAFFIVFPIYSQLESNRWYFTDNSSKGLTFNFSTGIPVTTNEHVNPYTAEGSGVANHPVTGALMFYVTSARVYDRLHTIMPNGSGLTNHVSNSQKGIICPKPGNCNQYYIFQNTAAREIGTGSYYYSIIDMNLPGNGTIMSPRGDVVTGQKNQLLKTNTGEATCLIKSTSTDIYWLLVSTYDINEICIYKIDSGGISLNSTYNVPVAISDYRYFNYSYESQKICLTSCAELDPTLLFNFNRATGNITSTSIVPGTPLGNNPNYWTGMYANEWSLDGSKLYIGKYRWNSGSSGGGIYQYDLNLPANPIQNVFMNGGGVNNVLCDLKRAPNGEIYFIYDHPVNSFRYLGKINFPNNAGTACNVVPLGHDLGNGIDLNIKFSGHLPSNEKPVAANDSVLLGCTDTVSYNIDILGNDFDPDDNRFSVSFFNVPSNVTVLVNPDQTVNVQVNNMPPAGVILNYLVCDLKCNTKCDTGLLYLVSDTIGHADILPAYFNLCNGDTISVSTTQAGTEYLWNTGDTTATINVNLPGTYQLQINQNDCFIIDSTIVLSFTPPHVDLGSNIIACDTVNINLNSNYSGLGSISWNTGDTLSQIIIHSPGLYSIQVSNICGFDSDSVYVTLNQTPYFTLADTSICSGDSLTLNLDNSFYSIEWSTGDTNSFIHLFNHGIYWAEASNSCGTHKDSILLEVVNYPQVNLGNDSLICSNMPVNLTAYSPESTILWNTGDTSHTISINTSGSYWVIANNSCGSVSDSIEITFILPPVVSLNDTSFCNGLNINFTVPNDYSSILWSNGDTTNIATFMNPGIHWVNVTNECGNFSDTFNIEIMEIPSVNLPTDSIICSGQNITLAIGNIGADILWSTGQTDTNIIVSTSGTYWVTASNICGADTDTIALSFSSVPVVDLGPDITLCENQPLSLSSICNGCLYNWSNGSTNSQIDVSTSGNYHLNVTNDCGSSSDTVLVEFKPGVVNFDLPNVFTPDDDGINDTYHIEELAEMEFNIEFYDRWGLLLYQTNDFNAPWGGSTYQNTLVTEGVYYVILKFKNCLNENITKNQFIHIFR